MRIVKKLSHSKREGGGEGWVGLIWTRKKPYSLDSNAGNSVNNRIKLAY